MLVHEGSKVLLVQLENMEAALLPWLLGWSQYGALRESRGPVQVKVWEGRGLKVEQTHLRSCATPTPW